MEVRSSVGTGGDWVQEPPGSQSPRLLELPDVRTVAPSYLRFLLSRYGGLVKVYLLKKYLSVSGSVQFTSVVFKGQL